MKRFLLSTLLVCLMFVYSNAQVNQQDSLALVNIYNTTNGAAWTQKWIRTQPVSTWFGVTITTGRVTQINLAGNNLAGTLSSVNISKLTKLKVVNLEHNNLSGGIPAGIGSLTDLEQLNLSFNAFTGNIPSGFFNSLQKLKIVRLNNNNISGWFPSLSNAVALEEVNFANNAITNKIPPAINNLTHLSKFLVNNNKLFGALPAGILCSPALQIDVSGNAFTFTGLECLGANPNAVYNNQADLTLGQNNLKLNVTAGGTLTNNTYTWYRDDDAIPYFVSSNASIVSLNVTETGTYKVVVTNSLLPQLELKSNTVTISNVSALLLQDSLALVDLYNSTKGAQWINKTNWLTNAPLQNWFGVEIENGRVANLYLNENNLEGKINSGIRSLTGLKNIELVKNKLNGLLPDLSKALQLNTIRLSDNKFRGGLHSNWGNLVKLSAIELSSNELTGSIPESFGNLKKLFYLFLSNNKLSGTIPESVAAIPYWEAWFDHNQFTGPVPQAFCSGTSIINLAYNTFSFTGMECFGDQSRILYHPQAPVALINENQLIKVAAGGTPSNNTYQWFKDNVLVDTKNGDSTYVPITSGAYHVAVTNSLATQLTLYSDTISITTTGSLATDSLALVDFYNNITSGLNWVLTNPVNTWDGVTIESGRVRELYAGNITGTLSNSLGNLSELEYLQLWGNISGTFPASVSGLTKLVQLAITSNSHNMIGSIPDDLGRNQQQLFFLSISGGQLSGTIPSGLQYATQLETLSLAGNQLTGNIPAFIGNLPIDILELNGNKLTGTIPAALNSLDGMTSINLSNNQLTGSIPQSLKNKSVSLDLSYNKLSGPLPDSIGNYGSWILLNNNRFTGQIPSLEDVDLQLDLSNNLLQSVSPSNCGLSFSYPGKVNLSNNQLNFTALECLQSISGLEELIISPQQRIPIINENPVLKAAAGGNPANNTYTWLKNTGPFITKVGDSTLTVTSSGVYACIVTNSNVPGVELRTHNANISSVSSRKAGQDLGDATNETYTGKLSVYPNPVATNAIYIKGLRKAESIILYNAAGGVVKQWQNVNGDQQLNIGSVINGIYMIKVVEKDKQTMLKFIKQ